MSRGTRARFDRWEQLLALARFGALSRTYICAPLLGGCGEPVTSPAESHLRPFTAKSQESQ
jgi:hypothetical protein